MKAFTKLVSVPVLCLLLAPEVARLCKGAEPVLRPTLEGTVKDPSEKPLSGASVFIYTAGPKEGAGILCPSCYSDCRKRTKTDTQGKFAIESLDPTLRFRILVVAKGFQPEFVGGIDPATKPVEVTLKPIVGGDAPNKRIRGIVVDPDGQPVSGALISIRGVTRGHSTRFGGNKEIDPVAVTDDTGAFVINGQEEFDTAGVDVEARALAKGIFQKLSTGDTVHTLKLAEGVTVKGKALKDGKPLAGIEIGIAGQERRSEVFVGDYSVATDSDGAFLFANLPARTDYFVYGLMKSLGDKGAIPSRRVRTEENGSTLDAGELAVQPGYRLEGQLRLTDSNAIPAKTRVMISREEAWDQLLGEVDERGRFKLTGLPAEPLNLHVRIDGYRLSLRNASLDTGNPFSLVGILRTNKTDLIVELEPGERLDRLNGDSRALAREPLRGAEAAKPEGDIKVTGKVVDADTGEPVPLFTVTEGRQDRYGEARFNWFSTRKAAHNGGTFTTYFTQQPQAPAVLIEAEGYYPQASAAITVAETNLTFALKKGNGPSGVLLAPDGRPAANVTVYLADMRNSVSVDGYAMKVRERQARDTPTTLTDDAGRFSFRPQIDAYAVIVVDELGFLQLTVEALSKKPEVRLQPWARVEGQLLIGTRPGSNESVRLWPAHIPYEHHPRSFPPMGLYLNTTSDYRGRFVFERVPPIDVEVYHEPKVRDSRMGTIPMAQTTKLTLTPGKTHELTLGGKGRPVVGRFALEGYDGKVNWRSDVQMIETILPNPPGLPDFKVLSQAYRDDLATAHTDEEKAAALAKFRRNEAQLIEKTKLFYSTGEGRAHHFQKRRFALNFSQDGSFRIEDVPGGRYHLRFELREPDGDRFSSPRIASLEKEFEIPDSPGGRTDEPFDVGEISLQSRTTMRPGKGAPDFQVKTLDDKTLKLSDFKGKYVLLDFWAVWCGPCVAETPHLKEAYAAFKDHPQFAMIGLSLDPKPSAPIDYAKKNQLGWTQGFLGEWSKTDIPAQFGVEGIPAIFLIGPDGKIIAAGLRGDAIKDALQKALAKK